MKNQIFKPTKQTEMLKRKSSNRQTKKSNKLIKLYILINNTYWKKIEENPILLKPWRNLHLVNPGKNKIEEYKEYTNTTVEEESTKKNKE